MFIAYIVGARYWAKSRKREKRARAPVVGCPVEARVGFAGVVRKEAILSFQKWGAAWKSSRGRWLL